MREENDCDTRSRRSSNMPKCVVQAVDPVPLSARIGEIRDCYDCNCCIPKCICDCIGGNVVTDLQNGNPAVYVTLGLFTIVQLIRNVQMLIPVYDFVFPKSSATTQQTSPATPSEKSSFLPTTFSRPVPAILTVQAADAAQRIIPEFKNGSRNL